MLLLVLLRRQLRREKLKMSSGKKMTKGMSDAVHAKRRARQRYNINLNRHDYNLLCDKIRNGKATYLEKQSNTISHWLVNYVDENGKETTLKAVYSKNTGKIRTFLPYEKPKVRPLKPVQDKDVRPLNPVKKDVRPLRSVGQNTDNAANNQL